MMGNLGYGLKSHAVTLYEVGKLSDESIDNFLQELDTVEGTSAEGEAQIYFDQAIALRTSIRLMRYNKNCTVEGSDGGLDMFRCERLESLPLSTISRIFQNNYALMVSMAPISAETKLITSTIPAHFGPLIPEVSIPFF